MPEHRDRKHEDSSDRSDEDYDSVESRRRERSRHDRRHRRRSRSRDRRRRRSRSRSRSWSRSRRRDYERRRRSYSRDRSRHSESNESEKPKTPVSKETIFKKKQTSWDSKTPVSTLTAELCDTRALLKNKIDTDTKNDDSNKNTKIYITALDPGCTIDDIRLVFSSFGEITEIDLPVDPKTNRTKGYCFVDYRKKESADLAMVSMQGFHIKGKPIKLARPNISSSGSSSLAMGALTYQNPLANPIAAGAVAAATLLQNRSGFRVDTSNVLTKISASTASVTIGPTPPELNGKRVVLENIPFELKASDIRRIFEPFGAVLECVLYSREMLPGAFYACGYIDFQNANVAQTVCSTMNGFEIAGSKVQVTMAPESAVAGTSNVIVIYNAVDPTTVNENVENEVKEECSKYGTVTSVYVHFAENNVAISVFVVYSKAEEAEYAVQYLNGNWFKGRQIMCRNYDASAYFSGNYEV